MNLEFKEPFFRFIFPSSLLCIFIFIDSSLYDYIDGYLPFHLSDPLFFLVAFIAVGLLINSISGFFISFIIIKFFLRDLNMPKYELNYWRKLSQENEFIQKKIDRRWDFFTANFNCFFAIAIYAIIRLSLIGNENISSFSFWSISVLLVMLLFGFLSFRGFRSIRYYVRDEFKG